VGLSDGSALIGGPFECATADLAPPAAASFDGMAPIRHGNMTKAADVSRTSAALYKPA
jgi:hypothetical protein